MLTIGVRRWKLRWLVYLMYVINAFLYDSYNSSFRSVFVGLLQEDREIYERIDTREMGRFLGIIIALRRLYCSDTSGAVVVVDVSNVRLSTCVS